MPNFVLFLIMNTKIYTNYIQKIQNLWHPVFTIKGGDCDMISLERFIRIEILEDSE